MEAAMAGSTMRAGMVTTPSTARARVMLWAMVKAVMILKSDRKAPPRRRRAARKSR
jgi:hypothetical protein